MEVIELKNKMNAYLKEKGNSYRVEVLIPLTKNWAYYRDNDTKSTEWLVHLSCPELETRLFCWTFGNTACTGCEKKPSRESLRKKNILSKVQRYAS